MDLMDLTDVKPKPMELTYADTNNIELGRILDFNMDTAIGKDENKFSVTIPLGDLVEMQKENRGILPNYRLYIDETEMGGIIDTIIPNTEDETVTYEGRTWHGIIDGKIIEPLSGQDYYSVQGNANTVLSELINYLGLSNLFTVSTELSTVTIKYYQFERYTSGFIGICKMLYANDGKLVVEYSDKICHLSVVPLYDYSESEEFDSSQVDFKIEKNYRPTNHLICLGKGDLKERKVIHLFTDENGGIRPYASIGEPYKDSHYILTKQNQVLTGMDEVTEVVDYGNAETVYNYVLLESKPIDWDNFQLSTSFAMYYTQNENANGFTQNKIEYADNYNVLSSQPADWLYDYGEYYYYDSGTSSYKEVNGVEGISYNLQGSQPSDWSSNYGNYYINNGGNYEKVETEQTEHFGIAPNRPFDWDTTYSNYYYPFFDGVEWIYKSASGTNGTNYKPQTGQPSDWKTNYSSYYSRVAVKKHKYEVRKKVGKKWVKSFEYYDTKIANVKTSTLVRKWVKKVTYEYRYDAVQLDSKGKVPKWEPKKYYTSDGFTIPAQWKDNYFYIKTVTTGSPTWEANTYYTKTIGETAPTFTGGTYFKKTNDVVIPTFANGTYYQRFEDNYATLVEKGIETLRKSYDCDSIDIGLDTDYEYDINDVIGAREQITGISIFQPIVKKIYKVKNNIEPTITYEIGAW